MTTTRDTNVLLALWSGGTPLAQTTRVSLARAGSRAALLVSPAVYAELLAAPGLDEALLDSLLREAGIGVDRDLGERVWRLAGRAHRDYAARRRAQRGDTGPQRILTDFIIGAHAVHRGAVLLTFDRDIFRAAFPALTVLAPDDAQGGSR